MIHTGALLGEKCGVYTRKEKNRNIHAREVAKTWVFQQLPILGIPIGLVGIALYPSFSIGI